MKSKYTIILTIGILYAAGFVSGAAYERHNTSSSTTTHTDTQADTHTNTEDHKKTVITETPGGTKTTVITEDSSTKQDQRSNTSTTQTVVANRKLYNVSAIAGVDTMDKFRPVYGLSASKEFLGPITLGIWGMTNSVIGLSIGINF